MYHKGQQSNRGQKDHASHEQRVASGTSEGYRMFVELFPGLTKEVEREGKAGGRTPGGGARVHVHFTCRVHRGGRAWQMLLAKAYHRMPVGSRNDGSQSVG